METERSITTVACSCNKPHNVLTKEIVVKKNAVQMLPRLIQKHNLPQDILLVYDTHTYAAADSAVSSVLKEAGMTVREHIFDSATLIHPDERAVGELMFAMEPEPKMLVAVGSGTLNDLCRFCANRLKIPYMVVATAPSMDGYASTVTPITYRGMKISYIGIHPEMIIGDLDILRTAPSVMIAAGFGDILGKIPAHLDWKLAHIMTGEEMCDRVLDVAKSSVDQCMMTAPTLAARTDDALKGLMDALVLSGIAMQMQGNSRPASGAEHHLAHYLEMQAEVNHEYGLHGIHVGMATMIIMRLYGKLCAGGAPSQGRVNPKGYDAEVKRVYGDLYPQIEAASTNFGFIEPMKWVEQRDRLVDHWQELCDDARMLEHYRQLGVNVFESLQAPYTPQQMGYDRALMRDALLYCRLIRKRFTILTVLQNWGLLEQYVDEVLDEIYA